MSTNLVRLEQCESDAKTIKGLSAPLVSLLRASDGDAAKLAIAGDVALLNEARGALAALRRHATAPAGPEGVKAVIGRRFATFPQPQREPEEWAAWWADYTDALEDVSAGAIEAGLKAWIAKAGNQFLPMPGDLRALARSTESPALVAYNRAYFASVEANDATRPERMTDIPQAVLQAMPTADERQSVRRMADDFLAEREARKPDFKSMRPNQGSTIPGHHITPELRASILGAAAREGNSRSPWCSEVIDAVASIGAEPTIERQGVA